MRLCCLLLAALIALLQLKLWFSDVGQFAVRELQEEFALQQDRNAILEHRNARLTAEVIALKTQPSAIEARARQQLGMIKRGEVFYFVPNDEADADP